MKRMFILFTLIFSVVFTLSAKEPREYADYIFRTRDYEGTLRDLEKDQDYWFAGKNTVPSDQWGRYPYATDYDISISFSTNEENLKYTRENKSSPGSGFIGIEITIRIGRDIYRYFHRYSIAG